MKLQMNNALKKDQILWRILVFYHYYRTPKVFKRHRFRLDVLGRHLEKFLEQKGSCMTSRVFSA